MSAINQKEYLKKYLGIGKTPGEKKKKKKDKPIGNRLKIIDDDVDVLISREIEDDIAAANEDAPQIVAVIDERPIALQVDEKTHSSLWKPIGEPSSMLSDTQSLKVNSFKLSKQVKNSENSKSNFKVKKKSSAESSNKTVYRKDNSLQGQVKEESYIDTNRRENETEKSNSSHRKYSGKDDYSLPRKREYSPRENHEDCSPPRRKNRDNDYSPSRKKHHDKSVSPVRNREADNSPPRRKYREDDNSPPRRRKKDDSTLPRRTRKDEDYSPPRKRSKDEDSLLPIKKRGDDSPPRRNKKDDSSPLRRKNREEDNSPPRRRENDDLTPPRRNKESSPSPKGDFSPPRKSKRKDGKKSRWSPEKSPESSISQKMKKTLDGKQAGLQSAQELSKESKHLRQKEDEIFKNMSAEISGKNAATVIRGRKVKNLEEEAAKERRDKDLKEKYDRWGKGLRQVEDQSKKIEEQLHEMSKPLARYADDEDLEKYLKEQEREGDPMLAYIRKKKKKEKIAAGIPDRPMYNGEFMPNRFGIRPGYRWDGVDRSNGYEKKWFQVQNAKKADREEAFKWSTEDM